MSPRGAAAGWISCAGDPFVESSFSKRGLLREGLLQRRRGGLADGAGSSATARARRRAQARRLAILSRIAARTQVVTTPSAISRSTVSS